MSIFNQNSGFSVGLQNRAVLRTATKRATDRWTTSVVLLGCIGASLAVPPKSALGAESGSRPNIVLVLADDLGYGDPGCYNPDSKIPTPNIDRLAVQGMRFTDAHTPSAVCTPTRYGLLTGRYCWRSALKKGVLDGYSPLLIELGRLTVASLLQKHGYATACIGKWHLGLGTAKPADFSQALVPGPRAVGFDYFFGIPASLDMPPYVFVENERVTEAPTATIAASTMRRHGGNGFWRAGAIAPHFKHDDVLPKLTTKAVEYIHKQSNDKPFFLYLALTAPHTPWLPTAAFRFKSGAGYYGDFVAQVDAVLGTILGALEDSHLADNTLVIFTSDNGAHWLPGDIAQWKHRANDGWRGQKADIWDGGHRVPFIARWPAKIRAGSASAELICLTDFVATAAALVGAKLPADAAEDSFDITTLLRSKKQDRAIHEAIVHHSADGTFGIRQGPWKLAMALGSHGFSIPTNIEPKPGEPRGQLYNLDDDPEEKNNLWLVKPEIVNRLTALLEKYKTDGRSRPK
jgi:arylsulfatase A